MTLPYSPPAVTVLRPCGRMTDPRAAELTWLDLNDPNPPVGEDRLYPGGTVLRPADKEARP